LLLVLLLRRFDLIWDCDNCYLIPEDFEYVKLVNIDESICDLVNFQGRSLLTAKIRDGTSENFKNIFDLRPGTTYEKENFQVL